MCELQRGGTARICRRRSFNPAQRLNPPPTSVSWRHQIVNEALVSKHKAAVSKQNGVPSTRENYCTHGQMQKHSKRPLLVGCGIGHKLHPWQVLGSTWVKRKKVTWQDGFCHCKFFLSMCIQNSGFTLQKKSLNVTFWKMAALISAIFWIHFCTVEGIKEVSSNFIVNGENSQPFSVCFLHPNKPFMILFWRVLDCDHELNTHKPG